MGYTKQNRPGVESGRFEKQNNYIATAPIFGEYQ